MWVFTFANNCVRFQDKILKRRRFMPKHKAASKGEKAVIDVLDNHGISYEMQYPLGYYVHVDFGIHYNNRLYLLEYDGRQHYHPVKYFGGRWKFFLQRLRDTFEKWECQDRNIPLLRIRYDVPLEEIDSMIIRFLNTKTS